MDDFGSKIDPKSPIFGGWRRRN